MPVTPWHPGDDVWIPSVGWQSTPTITHEASKSVFRSAVAAAAPLAAALLVSRATSKRQRG